jgi:hypothetical protein
MEKNQVKNLRSTERWWLVESIVGSFGSAEVTVVNVTEQGAHLIHAQPLRLATRARLRFKRGEIMANVPGMVVWSHLSKTPNEKGKLLYESGLRIEPEGDEFAGVVAALGRQCLLRQDVESMERKRRRMEERAHMHAGKPVMTYIRSKVSADEQLLIQQARERLRTNPDEAMKWYNRARFAAEAEVMLSSDIPYREEVIAIWEYLERSVPLTTIVRTFEHPL